MKLLLILLAYLSYVDATPFVPAYGPLYCGDTMMGTTTVTEPMHYWTLTTDDQISTQLISLITCGSSFDTVISLYILPDDDPTFLYASDDDGATVCGGFASKLEGPIPPLQTLYLEVEGISAGTYGDYTLFMNCTDFVTTTGPTPAPVTTLPPIEGFASCGPNYGETFDNGEVYWYFNTGDYNYITFDTCGSDTLYDTILTVYDAGFNFIASNDDHGGSTNPECLRYALHSEVSIGLEPNTDYYVGIRGFGTISENWGPYDINMQCKYDVTGITNYIYCDDTLRGTTNANQTSDWYIFDLLIDTAVTFDTCDSLFDTEIYLFDVPNNDGAVLLDSNDDGGSCQGLDSELYQVLFAGTYYVAVGPYTGLFENSPNGNYNFSMKCDYNFTYPPTLSPSPEPTPLPTVVPTPNINRTIYCGDTITDITTATETDDFYTFDSGDYNYITIDTCGSDSGFDTTLKIFDDSWNQVAYNDQASPSCASSGDHSRLTYQVTPNSRYYIEIDAWIGLSFGQYDLNLDCQYKIDVTAVNETITCGNTIIDSTDNNASNIKWYEFHMNNLTEVTLDTCSSGYDTYLYITDIDGYVIYEDDDGASCGGLISSITELFDYGTYYVGVGGCCGSPFIPAGRDFGTFYLNMLCNDNFTTQAPTQRPTAEPTPAPTINYEGPIYCDETIMGTTTSDPFKDWDYYTFTVNGAGTGSFVAFSTCNSDFDTKLYIYDDTLTQLYTNDDGGNMCPDGLHSYIATTSLADGVYTVGVTGFASNVGNYTLQMWCDYNMITTTLNPTVSPTDYPTFPTDYPTDTPSDSPTQYPSDSPTQYPTDTPTYSPVVPIIHDDKVYCDDKLSGTTTKADDEHLYSFEVMAPLNYIAFSSCGSEYDTLLTLYDAGMRFKMSNDDAYNQCDNSLHSYLYAENLMDGWYTLGVSGYDNGDGPEVGDYTVNMVCSDDMIATTPKPDPMSEGGPCNWAEGPDNYLVATGKCNTDGETSWEVICNKTTDRIWRYQYFTSEDCTGAADSWEDASYYTRYNCEGEDDGPMCDDNILNVYTDCTSATCHKNLYFVTDSCAYYQKNNMLTCYDGVVTLNYYDADDEDCSGPIASMMDFSDVISYNSTCCTIWSDCEELPPTTTELVKETEPVTTEEPTFGDMSTTEGDMGTTKGGDGGDAYSIFSPKTIFIAIIFSYLF